MGMQGRLEACDRVCFRHLCHTPVCPFIAWACDAFPALCTCGSYAGCTCGSCAGRMCAKAVLCQKQGSEDEVAHTLTLAKAPALPLLGALGLGHAQLCTALHLCWPGCPYAAHMELSDALSWEIPCHRLC